MIHQVSEGRFEAQAEALAEMEILGETGGDCCGAGCKENADAAITHGSRRNGAESFDVKQAAIGGDVAIGEAIGALKCTAIGNIQISRIVAGTGDRREIRPCFPEADGADGPSSNGEIGKTVHVREESAILADREIVDGGEQETIAARVSHIAAVGGEIESVGDWCAVNDFRIEGGGRIAANVAEALGPHVAGLEGEAVARTHVEFGLQSAVADVAGVGTSIAFSAFARSPLFFCAQIERALECVKNTGALIKKS